MLFHRNADSQQETVQDRTMVQPECELQFRHGGAKRRVKAGNNLGVGMERMGTDMVDVGLVEAAQAVLLGALTAKDRSTGVSFPGEDKLALMLGHEPGQAKGMVGPERHGPPAVVLELVKLLLNVLLPLLLLGLGDRIQMFQDRLHTRSEPIRFERFQYAIHQALECSSLGGKSIRMSAQRARRQ